MYMKMPPGHETIGGDGEIEPRHLPGEDTCADALTKPLDKKRFVRLREYLMNSRVAGNAAAG